VIQDTGQAEARDAHDVAGVIGHEVSVLVDQRLTHAGGMLRASPTPRASCSLTDGELGASRNTVAW